LETSPPTPSFFDLGRARAVTICVQTRSCDEIPLFPSLRAFKQRSCVTFYLCPAITPSCALGFFPSFVVCLQRPNRFLALLKTTYSLFHLLFPSLLFSFFSRSSTPFREGSSWVFNELFSLLLLSVFLFCVGFFRNLPTTYRLTNPPSRPAPFFPRLFVF